MPAFLCLTVSDRVCETLPIMAGQVQRILNFCSSSHMFCCIRYNCDQQSARWHACVGASRETQFEVAKVSTPPEKRSIPTQRIRQRDLSKGWNHHKSDVLMLRGRVRSGQKIESRKHIVITGDVNPGAEINAGGDIIVLGRLSGKVYAGCPDNDKAIIFALEFKPTQVQIGTIAAAGMEEEFIAKPEYASVEDGGIMVKDYMKANPFRKMPWPEAI